MSTEGLANGILLLFIIMAAVALCLFFGGKKMRGDRLRIDLARNEVRSIASIDRQMTAKYGGD